MIVGHDRQTYAHRRNIINRVPAFQYRLIHDAYSVARALSSRLGRRIRRFVISPESENQFRDFDLNSVDIIHLFNSVSYGQTPWVSTFETALPRFTSTIQRNWHPRKSRDQKRLYRALVAMAGAPCQAIIALSRSAYDIQQHFLTQHPAFSEAISKKLVLLHPPQRPLISPGHEKPLIGTHGIRFMFVGRSFTRKGGREILDVFDRIRRSSSIPIHLTIVSSLKRDPLPNAPPASDDQLQAYRDFFADNSDWIQWHQDLPHNRVLELMRDSHVGLLPTYADTYGYSALEFMAAGCPVISTDVRALAEINDQERGWLISVPRDAFREAIYRTPSDRVALSLRITAGLENALREILARPQTIHDKALRALEYVIENHDPGSYADALEAAYRGQLRNGDIQDLSAG